MHNFSCYTYLYHVLSQKHFKCTRIMSDYYVTFHVLILYPIISLHVMYPVCIFPVSVTKCHYMWFVISRFRYYVSLHVVHYILSPIICLITVMHCISFAIVCFITCDASYPISIQCFITCDTSYPVYILCFNTCSRIVSRYHTIFNYMWCIILIFIQCFITCSRIIMFNYTWCIINPFPYHVLLHVVALYPVTIICFITCSGIGSCYHSMFHYM